MVNKMKISIVMATYNGELYIEKQLASICNQTVPPDEIIISDDRSSDNTISIIKSFINKNNIAQKTNIYVNNTQLGFAKNFLNAISKSSGDILFFCDQDDIWNLKKIERFINIFKEKKAMAVMGRQKYIDEEDNEVIPMIAGSGIYDRFSFLKFSKIVRRVAFSEQINSNRSTGMALAARREIVLSCILYVNKYGLSHDSIIGLYASLCQGMYFINENLVYRRIHASNTSQPILGFFSRVSRERKFIMGLDSRIKLLNVCLKEWKEKLTLKQIKNLKKTIYLYVNIKQSVMDHDIRKVIMGGFSINKMINIRLLLLGLLLSLKRKIKKSSE